MRCSRCGMVRGRRAMARLMPLRCRECGRLTVAPWHRAAVLALLLAAAALVISYLLS